MGGDRLFEALEAHALGILGRLEEEDDLFLREDEGVGISMMSVVCLLTRHGITPKKDFGYCRADACQCSRRH